MGFDKKTVLVTGSTGLIGSHLVHELVQKGNTCVIASARNEKKVKTVFADILENKNFHYIIHDIANDTKITEQTVDYIFHAAGPIAGDIIKSTPVDVIMPNLDGLRNCLEFLRRQKAEKKVTGRLVLFSSATIYGRIEKEEKEVREEDTSVTDSLDNPNAVYSETKRMCEVMGRAYAKQYGLDVVIARFSFVYGYTTVFPNTAFYQFIETALSGNDIELRNQTFMARDNIHIKDAISGLIYVCLYGSSGEAYNVSSDGELQNYASIDEMATRIVQSANRLAETKTIAVRYCSEPVVHQPGIRLDNRKLKALGWRMKVSLSQGIDETLWTCLKSRKG